MGARSFQRGTVVVCRSKGGKVTACQIWRMILWSRSGTWVARGLVRLWAICRIFFKSPTLTGCNFATLWPKETHSTSFKRSNSCYQQKLKKRIGLFNRIKKRVPKEKLIIITEAIFNSKIRYGISIYLNPVYKAEDLKLKKLSKMQLNYKLYKTPWLEPFLVLIKRNM